MTTKEQRLTAYRSRNLNLDQFQKEIESYLGMSLFRGRCDESNGTCELMATSPTGVILFKIHSFSTERDGWRFGGHGELLGDSHDDLSRMHEEAVEIEI